MGVRVRPLAFSEGGRHDLDRLSRSIPRSLKTR
jgi:hypothetical protein